MSNDVLDRIRKLSPKRLALLALDLQNRLDKHERRETEPIAVIGIGCRFPGRVDGPDSFWQLLSEGVDGISEVPPDRWDIDAYFDPDPQAPGKMVTRWGGFLDQVDQFDAKFFGIAPREAVSLDPQQRVLLEVVWEAIENAGQSPDRLMGSRTGVFVGMCSGDYYQRMLQGNPDNFDAYLISGGAPSMAAGRISYILGLQGPSFVLDTACSSSLVAVHVACQSLKSGECDMALAGGVSLILNPEPTIGLSRGGMLSPDGRCKTFDAEANGFVRGEGCGVIILKRLSDAEANGDNILAVVRGSAVNQDGRSSGITAPNGSAQEAVIRQALEKSGIDPMQIDYIETHGTGTKLGDPIEVRALGAVLGQGRSMQNPVKIGSVKTNFGHLEMSAGIAGLIKVVLALQQEEIPAHLHLKKLNPYIEWDQLPVIVTSRKTPWPRGERRRIAGVSSFGFSGTNAHVILEEAPQRPVVERADSPFHILTLSAKSKPALLGLASRYVTDLQLNPSRALGDVCFTASNGRGHFADRLAVVGQSSEEFQNSLGAFCSGSAAPQIQTGHCSPSNPPGVVFMFTGQGSQYIDMGRNLYATEPVFRAALDRCCTILEPYLKQPLVSVLFPANDQRSASELLLDQTGFTQPALFSLEYSLAELWRSWGVKPAAVLGHSLGEYVAACVAGVFSLEEGLRLVAERSRLMQALPAGGTMAVVFADEERVTQVIAPFAKTVSISAINGPENTVISGASKDIESIIEHFETQGISISRLTVSHAFHSPLMDPMLREFEDIAYTIKYAPPNIDLITNLTGMPAGGADFLTAEYWCQHARRPVRFAASIQSLCAEGHKIFLEIGPTPVLAGMANRFISDDSVVWLPSLRRGQNDNQQIFKTLASLYGRGVEIDWEGVYRGRSYRRTPLPTYPFERKRYWMEANPRSAPGIATSGTEPWRDWLYELAWQRMATQNVTVGRPDFIPSTMDIKTAVFPHIESLAAEHQVAVYDEFSPRLDALCTAYILKALEKLNWNVRCGDRISAEAILKRCGILARHTRLLGRILDILTEEGLLKKDGDEWVIVDVGECEDPGSLLEELRNRYPQCNAELTMTGKCAQYLADVLQGLCDPLELLFPKGSSELTEKMYQDAPAMRVFNSLVQKVITEAVTKLKPGRVVRILEVGAGTGGTSSYVLSALPQQSTRYVYTDVSELFITLAKEKFKAYPFIEYRLLDVSMPPESQGFESQGYDIVLASNVLHATPDVRHSLAHLKRLLTPGGLLVFLETTVPQRFGDLTVGLTEGWWGFTDTHLRPGYALLTVDKWCYLLDQLGFKEIDFIPGAEGRRHRILTHQAVMLARNPSQDQTDDATAPDDNRVWLILADDGGMGESLAQIARGKGQRAILVTKGHDCEILGHDHLVIDPLQRENYQWLIDTLAGIGCPALLGVVHLWGLDETLPLDCGSAELDAIHQRSCGSLLYLVQMLATGFKGSWPRLALVTRGAQPVEPDGRKLNISQAALWGLCRVIAIEHPELHCIRIDLDPEDTDGEAQALFNDVLAVDFEEDQVARRQGEWLMLRMLRSDARLISTERSPLQLRSDGAYLVTGGMGGLGLLLADWLVAHGARHLVLMGRKEPSVIAKRSISDMTKAGALVRVIQGDVSNRGDVKQIVDELESSRVPLLGVFHCAGALDDGIILQQNWDRFHTVMAAKIQGAWNLHLLTQRFSLDYFVLFSSGAAFLGSAGQGNHAAANAFMDALAHFRHAQGLTTLSVNWGAWNQTGAAASSGLVERLAAQGMDAINPDLGFKVLEHLLKIRAVQVAVLPIRWQEMLKGIAASPRMRFLHDFVSQITVEKDAVKPVERKPALLQEIMQVPRDKRRSILRAHVQSEALRTLGLDPNEDLDPFQPLSDLGLDSLMAIQLRDAISSLVGQPLPATLLFNYPSLEELVSHLDSELPLAQDDADDNKNYPSQRGQAGDKQSGTRAQELECFSEDEVARLLAEKLKEV